MKFTFRGGAREVGRSCIEVHHQKTSCLLDCGIKLTEEGTELPIFPTNLNEIDGVFISHAHLDHTGALPVLEHYGYKGPIFSTKTTRQITRVLLEDAFKIGKITHSRQEYNEQDIAKALNVMRRAKINEQGWLGNLAYKFFDAGHIPGSASIMLASKQKKILYTGDIKCDETHLLKGADTDYFLEDNNNPLDAMIIESTYGNRNHPDRNTEEKRFIRKIIETVDAGGSVIIPVFALGRAQEVLMILRKHINRINCPVYLDGMSVKLTRIILGNPRVLKEPRHLESAFSSIKTITTGRMRKRALSGQGVFITTSGMLTGGPVMSYLKSFHNGSDNSIFLTGYQGYHTNGHMLLKKRQVYLDGWRTGVKCKVDQFDFSAHADMTELKRLAKYANPDTLIIQHGEPDATMNLAEWAKELDFKVETPSVGDVVKI